VPPYRFTYLIEKARQYASTVQTLGSQLLSVIEKRDGEELAQLRTVHEQNLLMMRSKMAQFEIDAAVDAIEVLQRQKTAAEYKRDYFLSLCDVGLLASEAVQQQHQREASNYRTQAGGAQVLAAALSVIPDVGAPTAMKFGGSQLGAAGRALAEGLNALAAFNEMGASRAGIESSNRRRDQEWEHQVETAKLDVAQIEKQITAAEIKRDIAVRAREVHEKTIEQSDEVFAFFSEKFSNFGRYTLLSTRLHGLYRQAFDAALSMARMTEQAYRAERPDDDMLLSGKYWDTDNAGLLAGERLLADLQSLERRYIEKNYRQLEIEQTFSLAQHAPDALQALRLTGECRFDIPEWFFDLTYPGQYRRRLKAARLTIPCVTGRYTNVGATLHLERSEIRLTVPPLRTSPPPTLPKPTPLSLRHTVAIASSKAQYDSGVFDFTFRDERYMPFEGAGAISSWRLSLPKALRVFDYDTISDVMVHLSYTAEFSEDLKAVREDGTQSVIALLKAQTMTRVFSLRREFPDMFHRLISSPAATEVDLAIEQRHFPFFLSGGTLAAKAVRVRAVSPLVSMKGFTFALGPKVKPAPPLPAFRNVRAAHPAANEVHGQGLSAFELEVVLEADGSAHPGVAPSLTAEYLVKRGDIDPAALHDIILEVDYSLA
jgi:hypothetical protein